MITIPIIFSQERAARDLSDRVVAISLRNGQYNHDLWPWSLGAVKLAPDV